MTNLLASAKTWEEFLTILTGIFEQLKKNNLKLNIKKTTLCADEALWCGRIVTGSGVTFHPRNYDAMANMEAPRTAGELCQFIAGLTWMATGLPRLAQEKEVLAELMERIYKIAGSRQKKRFEHIDLTPFWNESHRLAFEQCKSLLKDTIENTHVEDGATLCLFTDASDRFYAALLTQVVDYDPNRPITEQAHKPVCTLSGKFTHSQVNWSTIRRERTQLFMHCRVGNIYS